MQTSSAVRATWFAPAALALLALCLVFWREALFAGKILVHGETVHFDLVMMLLQSRLTGEDPGVLWNDRLYGGFPLFAEGQAGFAQPLKLALALLFDPASAMMAYHFVAMLASALGMLLLGRAVGLGRMAALFASLATAFSVAWIFFHNNMVCAGTLACAPWVLLGVERWLARPDAASVLWLAVPASLMALSGYPHFTHAVAIHIACRLVVELCYREGRAPLLAGIGRYAAAGAAALLLTLALSAVQLLPLAELVSESHRSAGIGLLYPSVFEMHLRGLLFSFLGHYVDPAAPNLQGIGSGFVVVMVLCGLALCRDRRIVAHGVAALVLYNFGIQELSPLFRAAYEHSLVPGMRAFRFMWAYAVVAVIGFSLVAGAGLEALAGRMRTRAAEGSAERFVAMVVLAVASVAVAALAWRFHHPEYGRFQLISAMLFAPLCLAPLLLRRRQLLPGLALVLLCIECVVVRFDVFHFADRAILAEPGQAQAVRADGDGTGSYRVMDMTAASSFGYMPPDAPALEQGFRSMITSLTPMASVLWSLSSIDSVSSLGLHRRHLLYESTREEFFERRGTPGTRFIDVLGIRWVTAGAGVELVHAENIRPSEDDWNLFRNPHALPRFQLYRRARLFDSPEEVVRQWGERAADELYLDAPAVSGATIPQDAPPAPGAAARIELLHAEASRSELRVESDGPVWLFMADANFPGWTARVDGEPVPLLSAQVLGKAVHLPAGTHTVVIEFVSRSFRVGLAVSLLGCTIALAILMMCWRGRLRGPATGSQLRLQQDA